MSDNTACPHSDVRFCPLYIAAHVGNAPSCDDGRIWDGRCAVARGLDYRQHVELLRVRCPGIVELAEWAEEAERRSAQRRRNMLLNGVH
ncbi:MAG: hypothetical protein IH590_17955 [Aquamicrobium sp.]|nr:hypothetical protein [Aquamicrobium sp.]